MAVMESRYHILGVSPGIFASQIRMSQRRGEVIIRLTRAVFLNRERLTEVLRVGIEHGALIEVLDRSIDFVFEGEEKVEGFLSFIVEKFGLIPTKKFLKSVEDHGFSPKLKARVMAGALKNS